jgi:hypothetical protein
MDGGGIVSASAEPAIGVDERRVSIVEGDVHHVRSSVQKGL